MLGKASSGQVGWATCVILAEPWKQVHHTHMCASTVWLNWTIALAHWHLSDNSHRSPWLQGTWVTLSRPGAKRAHDEGGSGAQVST